MCVRASLLSIYTTPFKFRTSWNPLILAPSNLGPPYPDLPPLVFLHPFKKISVGVRKRFRGVKKYLRPFDFGSPKVSDCFLPTLILVHPWYEAPKHDFHYNLTLIIIQPMGDSGRWSAFLLWYLNSSCDQMKSPALQWSVYRWEEFTLVIDACIDWE